MLTEQMFVTQTSSDALLPLLNDLVGGEINGVAVKVGRVQELLLAGTISRQDFLIRPFDFGGSPLRGTSVKHTFLDVIGHRRPSARGTPPAPSLNLTATASLIEEDDKADNRELLTMSQRLTAAERQELASMSESVLCGKFQETDNLYLGIEILGILAQRFDYNLNHILVFDNTEHGKARLGDLVEELYSTAGSLGLWGVVRHAAAIAGKYPYALGTALTDILMYGKEVTIGKDQKATNVSTKLPDDVIHRMCIDNSDDRKTGILIQEIIYYLGLYVRLNPPLFDGFLRVRVNYIVIVLTEEMVRISKKRINFEQGFDELMDLSPMQLKGLVGWLLNMDEYKLHTADFEQQSKEMVMTVDDEDAAKMIDIPFSPKSESNKWIQRRMNEGSLSRVPKNFYHKVYAILKRCKGIRIGNRVLESWVTAGMTSGEKNYALEVENLMDAVKRPGMRQLAVEVLCTIADFFEYKQVTLGSVLFVDELLEAMMDSVLPSIYTEKLGEIPLFHYLDALGPDDDHSEARALLTGSTNGLSWSLDGGNDLAMQSVERMKDKMRKRIYSTPPLECGFLAVRALIDYYGIHL
jgi:phosphorylase kinase alpha/beta subunit